MSWLYTIVFAGLLISHNNEPAKRLQFTQFNDQQSVVRSTDDIVEKLEQSYPLSSNGRVNVSNINGSIIVEAWDRNEVRLEATKIADSRESMALMEIIVDSKPDSFSVKTEYKHWIYDSNAKVRRKAEVQYRLQVPKGALLDEIEAVNGSVSISNFTNFIKASAVNGPITATNLRGRIKLSTVNGTVKTDFDTVEPGTSISLDTVNGRVNLELPSDINATLKADTLNGSISNEFGLPVKKGKYVGRNLHGRVGSGDVQVRLSAVNGSLSIARKKDGRTPSNVTNLVNDDSDDIDSNEEYSADLQKTEKAMNEAVRSSSKAAEKGLKEAHKALEKTKNGIPTIEMPELKELKDLKVEINEKAVQKVVSENMRSQRDAMRMMSEALWRRSPIALDQKTKSFTVKGSPKVTVTAPKCKVSVRGWDQSTVKYVITEARVDRTQPVSMVEDVGEKSVSLTVPEPPIQLLPARWGDDNVIRLEVFIPRKSDLKVQTEQEIRLHGVSGEIELIAESEPVSVRNSAGNLKLTSSDGLVRVVGFKGGLKLDVSDSEVYLEGDFDKIDSHAVDGTITLTLPADKNASITTNSAIESEGLNIVRENSRTWRVGNGGPKFDFEFVDGSLKLRSLSSIATN